jgi:hypothetical protein
MVRVLELAIAVAVLLIFLGTPLVDLGLTGKFESIRNNPSLWLVMAGMFAPLFAVLWLFAFPPQSWLARLEFDHNCIRLVPKPLLRWIGEPSTEIPLSPRTSEILVCRGSLDNSSLGWSGAGNFPYGFRLLVRSLEGHDRELKVSTGDRLSVHQSKILADGITAATGLPVRLIQRKFATDGSYQVITWTPSNRFAQLGALAILAFSATPFVGGIVAGFLRVNPLIAVAVGVALWLIQTLAVYLYARLLRQKFPIVYWLSTVFTFSASYAVSIVCAFYLFHAS